MPSVELISAREFCIVHQVELSFVRHLHEAGLIELTIRDDSFFLPAGELPVLEKFVRWHYELAINSEGIEALSHVLQRMETLLRENRTLRDHIRRLEQETSGPVEPAIEI